MMQKSTCGKIREIPKRIGNGNGKLFYINKQHSKILKNKVIATVIKIQEPLSVK
jgi:hypothetical protein